MTGESQPELCHKDPLDGALSGLWFIWLGLLVGSGIILMVLCAIVFSGEHVDADLGDAKQKPLPGLGGVG